MHIDAVPNRTSRPTYLLRESYRQGKKVRKRTWPISLRSRMSRSRRVARCSRERPCARSRNFSRWCARGHTAHGHVQAVRVAMQRLNFESLMASRASPERDRVCAMVAARVLAPHTKLATTRWWHTTTLAEEFGVADADEDDLLLGRPLTPDLPRIVENGG
jgi:hypothetical protein